MQFSITTVLALAASAFAQLEGFGVVSQPAREEVVPAGQNYNIVWSSGNHVQEKITLHLMAGPTNTTLQVTDVIAAGLSNAKGSYRWAVPATLGDQAVYGIKVTLDSDPAIFQFGFPFSIGGGKGGASSTASTSAPGSITGSSTGSSSTATSTATITSTSTTTKAVTKTSTSTSSTSTKAVTVSNNSTTIAPTGSKTTTTTLITSSSTSSAATSTTSAAAATTTAATAGAVSRAAAPVGALVIAIAAAVF